MLFRKIYAIFILLLVFTVSVYSKNSNEEINTDISSNTGNSITVKGIIFTWNIDGEYLYGTLISKNSGWVAIGIDPKNMMEEADFTIAYIDNDEVYIRDDYGSWLTSHASDIELGGTDDVEIISGIETNEGTTIKFRKKLNTGDEYDKTYAHGQEVVVLLAASNTDSFDAMHVIKGKGKIMF